jgi:hypothetical protein
VPRPAWVRISKSRAGFAATVFMTRGRDQTGIFRRQTPMRGDCDIKRAQDGQFMTMGVVNCFLKIGRVARRPCHILDVGTTTHRPAGNRYALNRSHDQRSRGSTGYYGRVRFIAVCGNKEAFYGFISRGSNVWFALRVQTRYRVVAHPSRPWLPPKGGSTSVRKWSNGVALNHPILK